MNGYLYVASRDERYLKAACQSAESLLEFHPKAKITLFTEDRWDGTYDKTLFDNVFSCDDHVRAKLWALDKTPYDKTMYIDCDTYIQHEDIKRVFTFLKDNDIIFTRNRPYNAKITKLSDTEEMIYHCGVFVYKNNDLMRALMSNWFTQYCKQIEPDYDPSPYPAEVCKWDTFSMWYLLNKTMFGNSVQVGDFPWPDARWNFCMGQRPEELAGMDTVITHYTLDRVYKENESFQLR